MKTPKMEYIIPLFLVKQDDIFNSLLLPRSTVPSIPCPYQQKTKAYLSLLKTYAFLNQQSFIHENMAYILESPAEIERELVVIVPPRVLAVAEDEVDSFLTLQQGKQMPKRFLHRFHTF